MKEPRVRRRFHRVRSCRNCGARMMCQDSRKLFCTHKCNGAYRRAAWRSLGLPYRTMRNLSMASFSLGDGLRLLCSVQQYGEHVKFYSHVVSTEKRARRVAPEAQTGHPKGY